jgi:hypothetical protein
MCEQIEIKFKCLDYVKQNTSSTEEMIKEAKKIYDFVVCQNTIKQSKEQFEAVMTEYLLQQKRTSY